MPIIPEWIKDDMRYRWEKLDLKEKINSLDPKVMYIVTGVCIFIFLAATVAMLWPDGEDQVVTEYKKAWYYDLNTGELFVDKFDDIPPIEAPSGPLPDGSAAGVRAEVYSYVAEPTEDERQIGYLWKMEPGYIKSGENEDWDTGKLVKKPADKRWVKANSRRGKQITSELFKKNEEGIRPNICMPR